MLLPVPILHEVRDHAWRLRKITFAYATFVAVVDSVHAQGGKGRTLLGSILLLLAASKGDSPCHLFEHSFR